MSRVSVQVELFDRRSTSPACNAVKRLPDGRLVGDQFDGAGFVRGVQRKGLNLTGARVLVVGVETDLLFPLAQQRELASGLDALNREVHFVELPSIQGHDSFLVDMDRFRPILEVFFA